MQPIEVKLTLTATGIERGYLHVPKNVKLGLPKVKGKIKILLGKSQEQCNLTWDPKYQLIYGLTEFYKSNKVSPGNKVIIKNIKNKFRLTVEKSKDKEDISEQEAIGIIDISKLSTQAKGNIVEDRIKELILLHGNGLLNVYKPTTDTEGIDLIIVKKDAYLPLFLQIKGRYTGNNLIVQVKNKKPHDQLFIVGVYFDKETLEIKDKIALIPSKDFYKKGRAVKHKKSQYHRMDISLKNSSSARFTEYLVKKTIFVDTLIKNFLNK